MALVVVQLPETVRTTILEYGDLPPIADPVERGSESPVSPPPAGGLPQGIIKALRTATSAEFRDWDVSFAPEEARDLREWCRAKAASFRNEPDPKRNADIAEYLEQAVGAIDAALWPIR